MLEQLMVKNYILFEHAFIDFEDGMSVITGETGAGKSLLIDAIGYLMGGRINTDIVRKGKDKAILQMVLTSDDRVNALLEENGFEVEDELIISRTVNKNGKSSVRINQQVTTLSFLRQITSMLIDIHSQTDTYRLMTNSVQLDLLDQYAGTLDLKAKLASVYKEYDDALKALTTAKEQTYSDDELEFVTARLNEINEDPITEEEWEALQEQIREAAGASKKLEEYASAIYLVDQDNGINDKLWNLYKILDKDLHIDDLSSQIYDMYYRVQDISDQIKSKKSLLEQNAADLDALQEREYRIRKLLRRHGGSIASMNEAKEKYEKTVEAILHREDLLEKLEKKVKVTEKAYFDLAASLSKKRTSVFDELASALEIHFHDLMLENARFQIEWKEKAPSANGIDQIEFMVSMNPGQPFSPLKDSASGGELSRLMLALKTVFHSQNGIQTIIFDEIDTGVSGRVAFAMGEKMKSLSQDYQVLCITHLASVAAWADIHYSVSKSSDHDQTYTVVNRLDKNETLNELAVMASGNNSTVAISAAKELKKRVSEKSHG